MPLDDKAKFVPAELATASPQPIVFRAAALDTSIQGLKPHSPVSQTSLSSAANA
jgi:hypothetical protein